MITIISFIIVLGILVFLHEFGHFIVAKLLGIRVEKFSLGFGLKVFGFRKGDTEYLISLLPLGGYVKLSGENPEEGLKNEPFEFASRSVGDRAKVVVAGPLMNILLAVVLIPVVFMIGTQVPRYLKQKPVLGWVEPGSPGEKAGLKRGDEIVRINSTSVSKWTDLENFILTNPSSTLKVSFLRDGSERESVLTPLANENYGTGYAGLLYQIDPVVASVTLNYPAEKAGLRAGDRIISINGQPIIHWNQISELIQKNGGKEIELVVRREGKMASFSLIPKLESINGKTKPFIGIAPFVEMVTEKYGFFDALKKGIQKLYEVTGLTFYTLKSLITRKISVKTLGGPIMIAQITGQAAKAGIANLLFFMAFLSLNLAILNLLPIPVLDGGHLLFFLIEGLRGKPLGFKKMEIAQQIGLAILILLMLIVTYNDLQRVLPWKLQDFFRGGK